MVTEDYVSVETAKLLNIKGFKGEFHKHYWGYEPGKEFLTEGSFNSEYDYPAPTPQMAMKWLREVKNCPIEILWHWDADNQCQEWYFSHHVELKPFPKIQYYDTYEEATEAAIKYCLENLI